MTPDQQHRASRFHHLPDGRIYPEPFVDELPIPRVIHLPKVSSRSCGCSRRRTHSTARSRRVASRLMRVYLDIAPRALRGTLHVSLPHPRARGPRHDAPHRRHTKGDHGLHEHARHERHRPRM
jgi:hypothetical protein